jgi:hypothetical protein
MVTGKDENSSVIPEISELGPWNKLLENNFPEACKTYCHET